MCDEVERELAGAGFIAAAEEARELRAAAADPGDLASLLSRRLDGEPLAWLTGHTRFCGLDVAVDRGVYVPRPETEMLAERAAELLPDRGAAIDLCTGSGAIAMVLRDRRPAAQVAASDIDPVAVDCARHNGVAAHTGDLLSPLPRALRGTTDVIVAVVPFVPAGELGLLHRDALRFEPRQSFDGGADGLTVLRRVAADARSWLRPGGHFLTALGGDQGEPMSAELDLLGYEGIAVHSDAEGDLRGIEARRPA